MRRIRTRRWRARAADERGFSMAVAVIVLLASAIITYAAMDAVAGDVLPVRNSLDQNRALDAADAGLAAFRQQLEANTGYWSSCPTVSAAVPASTDDNSIERYSYKILPATTAPSSDDHCDTSNPIGTAIEGNSVGSGSFRVEVTGTSQNLSGSQVTTRSIVAQFRPPAFLNYVYFTNYEMGDPSIDGGNCTSWLSGLSSYGYSTATPPYYWSVINGSMIGPTRVSNCSDIEFITGDQINGPLHSNDYLDICGSPTFGRSPETPADSAEAPGDYSDGGCSNNATFNTANHTLNTNAGTLPLPTTNSALQTVANGGNSSLTNGCSATAGCVFTGPTWITLSGTTTPSTITITNAGYNSGHATQLTSGYPTNGVIYVQNGSGTCAAYNNSSPDYPTSADPCGDATVIGSYTSSLTIASANDVIVAGNVTTTMDSNGQPTGNDFLGLIANDFVRIAHPCSSNGANGTSGNYTSLNNPEVDAAILAVNHSFIVDNYGCGATLGTLKVDGALAQDFRGVVGTGNGGGGASTGYLKNYVYDGALQTESPPFFLNSSGTWQLVRETECDTTC